MTLRTSLGRSRSSAAALLAGLALAIAGHAQTPVAGAVVWSLTPSTAVVTQGTPQAIRLTATNESLLDEVGCVRLDVSGPFVLNGARIVSTTAEGTWSAGISGQSVFVNADGGVARLQVLQSVTFDVIVTPTGSGLFVWSGTAHRDQSCGGEPLVGVATVAVTVVAADPTPTPTPTPTPAPTPASTPAPTPAPTASATPRATPSSTPAPTPIRGVTTESPDPETEESDDGGATSPGSTPRSSPTSRTAATAAPSAPASSTGVQPAVTPPAPTATAPAGAAPVPQREAAALGVARADPAGSDAAQVTLGPLGVVAGLGVWAIPGAVISGPGLLVIVWVSLQAGAAAAWLPAVRRLRGATDGASRARALA